jgi:type VI secretion system secreted protein VgrG
MENIFKMTEGILNRYKLDIPSCPYPLDVERFDGLEQIALYHYHHSFYQFTSGSYG